MVTYTLLSVKSGNIPGAAFPAARIYQRAITSVNRRLAQISSCISHRGTHRETFHIFAFSGRYGVLQPRLWEIVRKWTFGNQDNVALQDLTPSLPAEFS